MLSSVTNFFSWKMGYDSEEAPLHDSEKQWSLTRQIDGYQLKVNFFYQTTNKKMVSEALGDAQRSEVEEREQERVKGGKKIGSQ